MQRKEQFTWNSQFQQRWPSSIRVPGRLCCATLGKPSPSLVTSEGGRQEPGQLGGGPAGRGMRWAAEGDADSGDGAAAAAGEPRCLHSCKSLVGISPFSTNLRKTAFCPSQRFVAAWASSWGGQGGWLGAQRAPGSFRTIRGSGRMGHQQQEVPPIETPLLLDGGLREGQSHQLTVTPSPPVLALRGSCPRGDQQSPPSDGM